MERKPAEVYRLIEVPIAGSMGVTGSFVSGSGR